MMAATHRGGSKGGWVTVHPLIVRVTHWINAFAMVCMVMSGWGIYNASPFFGFSFPRWATLGGWLGGSIAWHLAAMWLLVCNGLIYAAYGLISPHFRRTMLPLRPIEIRDDLVSALRFRLQHKIGTYNAVQRLLYSVVLLRGVAAVFSGLSLWKPVQFAPVVDLIGGYEVARRIHFLAMSGIVGFTVVHLLLVLLVPRTLPAMITGRARDHVA
jgi:thiosulfate reductase cytochrome b subunit